MSDLFAGTRRAAAEAAVAAERARINEERRLRKVALRADRVTAERKGDVDWLAAIDAEMAEIDALASQ